MNIKHCKRCTYATFRDKHGRCKPCLKKNGELWRSKAGRATEARARTKKWRLDNPDRQKKSHKRQSLKRYGLTLESFEILRVEQNDRCKICQRKKILVVDHDHTTGIVRSLLCHRCNLTLGVVQESSELLTAMAKYIKHHKKRVDRSFHFVV